MSASYNRCEAGAATFVRPAPAADLAWQRFKGTTVRFLISTQPAIEWAHEQPAGHETATDIRPDWQILFADQFRRKPPLTLRVDPSAIDGVFTLPSAASEAAHLPALQQAIYDGDVFVEPVRSDMIEAMIQGNLDAVSKGANPRVVPLPEVRAAIGSAMVAVPGNNAENGVDGAQRQVLQILKG